MEGHSIQTATLAHAEQALANRRQFSSMRAFLVGLLSTMSVLLPLHAPAAGFPSLYGQPDLPAADLHYIQSVPGCPLIFHGLNPVGICNIGVYEGQLVLKLKDAGFTVRPNADPHDIVASIPFDMLDVDQVTQMLLFFVSALGVLAGTLTTDGLTLWLNTHLREAVGQTVSVASNFVTPWLLSDNAMSMLVHQGVGFELNLTQQAAAQQLYNFFVFYSTSQDVLRSLVHRLTLDMETWIEAAQRLCPDAMSERFAASSQSMRLMAQAIFCTDASTAHVDVLLGTATELQTRIQTVVMMNTNRLYDTWNIFKSTLSLVTRHLKVRSNVHLTLVEAALQRGWLLHAEYVTEMAKDTAAAEQGEGLVVEDV